MAIFNYKCDVCGHDYQEGRAEGEPQWFTECPVNGCNGNLVEVK